jgi:CDP-diacylglycerol--glycerol-3-phosphate 3-phosphatidyltransferase
VVFLILYLLSGLSDVLDGYIARRTHTESNFGARLDSVADLLLTAVILSACFTWLGEDLLTFLPWLCLIAGVRVVNLLIAACKYHAFAIIHTWGNKLTGLLLFVAPLFIWLEALALLWPICLIAAVAAVEETLIHLTSPRLNLNRHSLLDRSAAQKWDTT